MKIILTEDVEKLGLAGDIKDVKLGYARNFLLPNRRAIEATPAAVKQWEKNKATREAVRAKQAEAAKELAGKIEGTSLSFTRPAGEGGKLFGSVGRSDIARSLESSGFSVDKTQVDLGNPLKEVGDHEVVLALKPGITAKIKVSILPRA